MDIFKRILSFLNLKTDQVPDRKSKKNNEETAKLKTKSQLNFENGMDDKPLITDLKYNN